jgi:hypothetical protein
MKKADQRVGFFVGREQRTSGKKSLAKQLRGVGGWLKTTLGAW